MHVQAERPAAPANGHAGSNGAAHAPAAGDIPRQLDQPDAPASIEEAGLPRSFLLDLIAKHLYRFGELSGMQIADKLCLPFPLLDEIMDEAVFSKLAEKRGGRGLGNSADLFGLTDRGRKYTRDIMEIDTYTGPAPVPLKQYNDFVKRKRVRQIAISEAGLRDAWANFVLDDELFMMIGPAMCSGKSCFLYGPPGTGKTTLAKAMAGYYDKHGGLVSVPHAVMAGGSVIRVFDPVYHQMVSSENDPNRAAWLMDDGGDRRWVQCHRPVVVVGGELTLDMLDLRYNATTRYYEAPLQMKANGGVFVIDDFGRQMVSPKDLLNRWIVPLEEHIDFLTLHTGQKFTVPFEQMVVFATNLNPDDLADEAFLRRIRYKVYIGELSADAYKRIFHKECQKKKLAYSREDLEAFIDRHYARSNRIMRACDPRDFTDAMVDYMTFNGLPRKITPKMYDRMALTCATKVTM